MSRSLLLLALSLSFACTLLASSRSAARCDPAKDYPSCERQDDELVLIDCAPEEDVEFLQRCEGAEVCDQVLSCLDLSQCGDGLLDFSEACEGDDLRGESCQSQGFESGTLSCDEGCQLDTSGCAIACIAPLPVGALSPSTPATINNDTSSGKAAQIGNNAGGGPPQCATPLNGKELIFQLPPQQLNPTKTLVATLSPDSGNRDVALYVRQSCDSPLDPFGFPFPCIDLNPGGAEILTLPNYPGAPLLIFVDSKDASGEGPFTLTIELQ